jgi:hypothetical protein
MHIKERPLLADEQNDFLTRAAQMQSELALPEEASADAIIAAIDAAVDRWQDEHRGFWKSFKKDPQAAHVAQGLAALWGQQLVLHFGWEWVCVQTGDESMFGVVSPDRAIAVYPEAFINACLQDPKLDCTVALAYNMLKEGKVIGLPPKGYEDLMAGVQRIVPKR